MATGVGCRWAANGAHERRAPLISQFRRSWEIPCPGRGSARKMQVMSARLLRLGCLALLAIPLAAQNGVPDNTDYFVGLGGIPIKAQNVPGTQVRLSSNIAASTMAVFGFHLVSSPEGNLWFEVVHADVSPTQQTLAAPGSVNLEGEALMPGLRYMAPLVWRFSVYGAAGAGAGFFNYPVLVAGPPQQVFLNSTTHGVFNLGGGLDFRQRWFSFRVDFRDLLTGKGLSGVSGRNHLVPTIGVVFHL
jgi:hypothetical protein